MEDGQSNDKFLIGRLTAKIYQLSNELNEMQGQFAHFSKLSDENVFLKLKIKDLEERLLKYENPKNSNNSNRPPSSDFPKNPKTNSLRGETGKKPGGQPGHKGNTLKMVEIPDYIEGHKPDFCPQCGKDISSLPLELVGKRQVIDIPPIRPVVIEHRVYKRLCTCGHCTEGAFPKDVQTPVSYGPGVQSLVAYLNTRHYVPIARTAEFLNDIFGLPVSTGGVCHLLNKAKQKALPVYEAIRQFVLKHTVIGADETGVNINGKNHWAWAFQNPKATFISIHKSRGSAAIEEIMPEGFAQNILLTDCWASYFKTGALSHQLCTAHLLRELKYFKELYPENTWVKRVSGLIENAIEMRAQGKLTPEGIREVHRSFWHLVREPATEKNIKELVAFQKRMVKYQGYVFSFLDNPDLVPDNNGSERAIRNFKVKQKVSGFFKSGNGSQIYATLRSIIDTAIKNDQNPYLALRLLS